MSSTTSCNIVNHHIHSSISTYNTARSLVYSQCQLKAKVMQLSRSLAMYAFQSNNTARCVVRHVALGSLAYTNKGVI